MNRSSTPQKCVKSHHIDKPTCWLLPRQQHRPSDILVFRCSKAVPTISLFTLSYCCYQQQLKTHFWWIGYFLSRQDFHLHYFKPLQGAQPDTLCFSVPNKKLCPLKYQLFLSFQPMYIHPEIAAYELNKDD